MKDCMSPLTSSVIICTRNRLEDIVTCLTSLAQQTQMPDELIVIDSSDLKLSEQERFGAFFNEKLFPFTSLHYVHTHPGLTYQRNIGITQATKDIIHFLDDDTILSPDYLAVMQDTFYRYPAYAGGMGTVTNVDSVHMTLHQLFRRFFLLQRDDASGNFTWSGMPTHAYGKIQLRTVQVLGGCCMAYRALVFKNHLFDEKLTRYAFMEDCDFSCRVAKQASLFFNPAAKLEHYPSKASRDHVIENRAMYMRNYSYLFLKIFILATA